VTAAAAARQPETADAQINPPSGEVGASFDRVERGLILALARLGEHPVVGVAAEVTLRAQIRATRGYRRAATLFWHACGVATFDEMNMLDDQLASQRHRLPARRPIVGDGRP
jgi:hypothetical protein